MKRLIVSCKTADQALEDFKKAAKQVQKKIFSGESKYEVSFVNKADFNRFVRNILVLSALIIFKPRSIYELARITGIDVSNLNKVILFFEEVDVIRVKTAKISGRKVKKPEVEYQEVTFKLAA